jgi:hypothetical protein
MAASRKSLAAMLLAGLGLAPFVAQHSAGEWWVWMRGGVVPSGTDVTVISGRPARIFTVLGHRLGHDRGSVTPRAIYHVLTLIAADSVSEVSTPGSAGVFHATATASFLAWTGPCGRETSARRDLVTQYDAVRRRVRIAGERFDLSRGNLFIVRYDPAGRQFVTQVPRTISDPLDTIDAFRGFLSRGRAVPDPLRPAPPTHCSRAVATGG